MFVKAPVRDLITETPRIDGMDDPADFVICQIRMYWQTHLALAEKASVRTIISEFTRQMGERRWLLRGTLLPVSPALSPLHARH